MRAGNRKHREPACHDDALRLLLENQHRVQRVISVDHDSILYVTPTGYPRTAWLHHDPVDGLKIKVEKGFVADTDWLH